MRRSWTILRVALLLTACFMARPLPAADEGHISGPFVHENLWRPGHRMTLTLPPRELVMIRIDVDSF